MPPVLNRLNRKSIAVLLWLSLLASPVMGQDKVSLDVKSSSDDQLKAAIIPIRDVLTDVAVESLRRRINEAVEDGATLLIFEMDTPGGLVTSAIDMADTIKNLTDVKTVAWVNDEAHSGGAIVAVACDEIVMTRSSRIGDAQVIMIGPGGAAAIPEEMRPKAFTPVLAEFRASARLRGYSQVLCEAFVVPENEVWWIEHTETGEREFVLRDEKIKRLGETDEEKSEDDDAEGDEQPTAKPVWKLVETFFDPILERDVDAIQPVVRDDQLLEMSPAEATAYGFCKAIVSEETDLEKRYSFTSLIRIEPTWSEGLAYWLTSMYVRGFLMVIIMLGAYVEFHSPGVGVPGLVALICLSIFVGAPYLTGLANVWEILLIIIGVTLIALEVFVIPGFGVPGISGILLLLIGMAATFMPDEPGRTFPLFMPTLESTIDALKTGIVTIVASMAISLAGMVMLSRMLPKMPMLRALIPANPTPSDVAVPDAYRGAARVGDIGESISPLHPSGKARFANVLVDVVTRGEFVDAAQRIEVVERHGNRVVVRDASETRNA